MNRYSVFKQTGTHADVLAAIGAADLLGEGEPRILEHEDRFELQLRKPLTAAELAAVDPGFSYFDDGRAEAPKVPPERIRHSVDFANGGKFVPLDSTPEHRMYAIARRMKAHGGPNKLVSQFSRMNRHEWALSVWRSLRGEPGFVFSAPLVQLFNPHSGKGYAFTKPAGTCRRDKTKDRWAEPFLEWLRYRGYFSGAAGWFASGDLRLYCPIPSDIPYDQLAAASSAFRELHLGGTAPKMDCRAMLALARILIETAQLRRPPRRSIRGIAVTHYKDMGQAHTVMSMEQLAVPDWFDLRTAAEAQIWLETIAEHDTILRRLTDSHSDEFALLKRYRLTFQSRRESAIGEFVEFLAEYSMLLFKRRARDYWLLPQCTASACARIVEQDPHLAALLRNPGFIAIAAAIRSSTLGAQAARHNFRVDHREIRYGLLFNIRAANRRELIGLVQAFVEAFNRESQSRRAAGLRAMRIQSGELAAFGDLLEGLPAAVPVSALLCGFSGCLPGGMAAAENEAPLVSAAFA